jgi:uncharacterized protein DUF3300
MKIGRTRRGWLAALVAVLLALPGPLRAQALDPGYLDRLLAPVALYPDQLLAQMLLSSGNARKVGELHAFLKSHPQLKGSELQQAVEGAGFEPSFVALAPFPQVVDLMAGDLTWTSQIGGAFAVDRGAVFDSIQRLRKQSQAVGNLKSTPQQSVETRTTQEGQQVIVIEPANPQVIYVPQYNPTVVYTQPASTTTTVVVHQDDDDEEAAAAAGALVGFAAGVAIGAAFDNHYYYGPYGWHGGAAMYNSGWNDWYDDRADAREDFYENREDARENYSENRQDLAEERSDRAENAREQRGETAQNRQEQRGETAQNRQEQRSDTAQNRQEQRGERSENASQQRTDRQQARSTGESSSTAASGQRASGERTRATSERSGTRSDAFSGYSSGSSTRSASERGKSSRSSSRSSGGRSRKR